MTDEELRQRLMDHGLTNCPPVVQSTRHILIRILEALDRQQLRRQGWKGQKNIKFWCNFNPTNFNKDSFITFVTSIFLFLLLKRCEILRKRIECFSFLELPGLRSRVERLSFFKLFPSCSETSGQIWTSVMKQFLKGDTQNSNRDWEH